MIGVFDSGVGGLTVVKEIFKYLPGRKIIYFGDTARLPYGTKGKDFVKRYSERISKWLLNKGARVIVVACNTSSAWAADSLKKKFKGVPIFEMIEPAVREVAKISEKTGLANATKEVRVGVIGTPGTIRSGVYRQKLADYPNLRIYPAACPLFVPLAEDGLVRGPIAEQVAKKYLRPLKNKKIDVLILGCTHYPLLKETIAGIMGQKVKIINPAEALAKNLKEFLEKSSVLTEKTKKEKSHRFFFSDQPYNFKKISHLCFNKRIKIEVGDPF